MANEHLKPIMSSDHWQIEMLGALLKPRRWHGKNIIYAGPFHEIPSVEEAFAAVKREMQRQESEIARLRAENAELRKPCYCCAGDSVTSWNAGCNEGCRCNQRQRV